MTPIYASEILGLAMIGIVLLFGFTFLDTSNKLIQQEQKLEQSCKDYLSTNGYTFVAYHHQSFGSPEECWGSKNGISVRVY